MDDDTKQISALLHSLVDRSNAQRPEDFVVLAAHSFLASNSFLCTGLEEQTETQRKDNSGQELPDGWNKQSEFYSLCYKFKSEEYLLKCLKIEDKLAFYLLKVSTGDVRETTIAVKDFISNDDATEGQDRYKDLDRLWNLLGKDLLQKSSSSSGKSKSSLRDDSRSLERESRDEEQPSALLVDPLRSGHRSRYPNRPSQFPPVDPFAYGDPDRLPGHAGIGGMRMDPFRGGGGGLRPNFNPFAGGAPGGARFDPFGPTPEINSQFRPRTPGERFDPDPDHMRRPNFDDDMFM